MKKVDWACRYGGSDENISVLHNWRQRGSRKFTSKGKPLNYEFKLGERGIKKDDAVDAVYEMRGGGKRAVPKHTSTQF